MPDVIRQAVASLNQAAEQADPADAEALRAAVRSLCIHAAEQQRTASRRHVLGDSQVPIRSLPDLNRTATRRRQAALSSAEQQAIIQERSVASNVHKLNLTGCHYELQEDQDFLVWL